MINSKVVLYEIPEEKMTEKEEQLLNDKIKILLEEVQRLCELEETCKNDNAENTSQLLQNIKKQRVRLETVEKYLTLESLEVKNFFKWVKSFDNLTQDLPSYVRFISDKNNTNISQSHIEDEEFEAIFSMWNPLQGIISSRG